MWLKLHPNALARSERDREASGLRTSARFRAPAAGGATIGLPVAITPRTRNRSGSIFDSGGGWNNWRRGFFSLTWLACFRFQFQGRAAACNAIQYSNIKSAAGPYAPSQ